MTGVTLACHDLWKLYGAEPRRFFATPPAAPAELLRRIREERHVAAVADASFEVRTGEILVIMGLSGSGKSTLLRCLSRLVEPDWGEIVFDGGDLRKRSARDLLHIRRHRMGMVFQHFGLMPHMTVAENIGFPLRLQGMGRAEAGARVVRLVHLVGLAGREDSFPSELSGGQQQRVGIARSLAVEPELWLLDEPFSALDPLIRRQMQNEFMALQSSLGKTIVFVTHDFLEALRIADRMMIMRDGQIVQIGTALDLIARPADRYVADFTTDAPLLRVLTARDGCEALARPAEGLPRVDAGASLGAILPLLARHDRGLAVEDGGRVVGIVTSRSAVAALARAATGGVAAEAAE